MNDKCPQCGSDIKTVPAGVSKKTNRPYNAFQACSNRECSWKPLQRPSNLPNSSKPYKTPHQELLFALREIYALLQHIEKTLVDFKTDFEMKRDRTDPSQMGF